MKIARLTLLLALAASSTTACGRPEAAPPPLRWLSSEPEALRMAAASGRPVLVDFWADWCGPCRLLDEHVWTDPRVREEARGFVLLRFDGSEGSAAIRSGAFHDAAEHYGIEGLPAVVLVDAGRRQLGRVEGAVPADEMLRALRAARRSCKAVKACS